MTRTSTNRALTTHDLPPTLALVLWPWIDTIETAAQGTGDGLRLAAGEVVERLRDLIVVMAPLETTMGDALRASEALAEELDRPGPSTAGKRVEALLVLHGLIVWLLKARPSERARTLGLGW